MHQNVEEHGPSGCSAAGPWWATPTVMVRIAGLSTTIFDVLRQRRLLAGLDAYVQEQRSVEWEGRTLADRLHAQIGGLPDPAARPVLIGLRRALFCGRLPDRSEWNQRARAVLPVDLAVRIDRWVVRTNELRHRRQALPELLETELAEGAPGLRSALAASAFRRALAQASPQLCADLERWLAQPNRRPKTQKLLRLVRYASRAAAKTSPFSTFTSSGLARWCEQAEAARCCCREKPAGVLLVDGERLGALRRALAHLPETDPIIQVRANPSLTVADGELLLLGPAPDERLVATAWTPAIARCLDLLAGGPLALRTLLDQLTTAAGGGERAGQRVRAFVDAMVRAGVLERRIPIPDHSPDPLGELERWLARSPAVDERVRKSLSMLREEIRRPIPPADTDGHRARLRAAGDALRDLDIRLRLPFDELATADSPTGLHESSVFTAPVAHCSAGRWRPALDDLDVIRRWLAFFDHKLPIRLAIGSYVGQRFGPAARVPFLVLYRTLERDLAETAQDTAAGTEVDTDARHDLRLLLGPAPEPGRPRYRLARLRTLQRLRDRAIAEVLDSSAVGGVIRVDAELLARQLASWPAWFRPPESVLCYLQLAEDERAAEGVTSAGSADAPRLVLNTVHAGHGRARTRLRYLIDLAGAPRDGVDGDVRPEVAFPAEPSGATVDPTTAESAELVAPVAPAAELGGLLDSTLNVRLPGVPYEIDYPGAVSGRPEHERIPLNDLEVAHDPDTDLAQLRSRRLGTRIRPLHLGMSSELRLPPAARFLDRAFIASSMTLPSVPTFCRPDDLLAELLASEDTGGILRHPRVQVGRVVVQRARWSVPTRLFPARAPGDSDVDLLSKVVEWLRAEQIPERSFVRIWDGRVDRLAGKGRKPQYVDFGSWYLAIGLERQLAGSRLIVFEEALPDPAGLTGPEPDEPRVTEFLVELNDAGGGHDD